jgi:ubiquitin C-terminal hydrolase
MAFPARKLQGVDGTASGTYHLTALVEHDGPPGDANHGHYFCHVQRDSSWCRCSDADIVQVGSCTPCPRMHACIHDVVKVTVSQSRRYSKCELQGMQRVRT